VRLALLRIVLAVVIVATLVLGIVCYLSGDLALKAGRIIYGATLTELTPQVDYIVKMMGCYLIALGLLNVLAIADPLRFRHVVYVDVVLALLRALQRILFAGAIHRAFGVSYARVYTNAAVMILSGLVLLALVRMAAAAPRAAGSPAAQS
jgi:hypothetical protein